MEARTPQTMIARRSERERCFALVQASGQGRGGILCLNAESGYGKTMLLQSIAQDAGAKSAADVIRVECPAPIGNLNISSIQPMQPWVKALEALVELKAGSAKKRLVVNIGLSVLGMIPIAGSIFDITKEIMRDLREYRADKKGSQEAASEGTKLFTEFKQTLDNIAEQRPFVLMIDDAQWMDAQSVEFLNFLSRNADALRFSIILSYQHATVEVKNPALSSWLQEQKKNPAVEVLQLQAFTAQDITECVRAAFPSVARNAVFEDWLMRRTAGIPMTIMEYLDYFQRQSPFREDGTLDSDRLNSQSIPASLQAVFARNLESLSEADRATLAVCSAEGRECTVFIVARLLNTDTLSAIKNLKSLQYRTGLIRSTGAQARYGMRSTVYEFTQALHHTYFHSTLEHEERVELHERIASILRERYNETQDEQLQRQLAPYIAAHALEAGDENTARAMLVESAHAAEESGSADIVHQIVDTYQDLGVSLGDKQSGIDDNELSSIAASVGLDFPVLHDGVKPPQAESPQGDSPDCAIVRDDILEFYFNREFEKARDRGVEFLEQSSSVIDVIDRILILAMIARTEIELGEFDSAREHCDSAMKIMAEQPDDYGRCVIENIYAIIVQRQQRPSDALRFLQQAAHSAATLSDDMKLLTMTNIAIALHDSHPRQSKVFERIARQLSNSLRFHDFAKHVFRSTE